MEQSEVTKQALVQGSPTTTAECLGVSVAMAGEAGGCPTCVAMNGGGDSYVYALGRIEARFPTPSIEKEFAQAAGRADTTGKSDRQTFHAVLSARENRYLARQLCWVFSVQGLETYLLVPRDSGDVEMLIDAVRPAPHPADIDVVIGRRGPIAPPEACNGLMVPTVAFDQIYSFDRETLISAIPKPEKLSAEKFAPIAEEVFD